jgi:hypothetical protein
MANLTLANMRLLTHLNAQQVANKLLADVRLVQEFMPRKISDGPADPFDLEFTEFGVR